MRKRGRARYGRSGQAKDGKNSGRKKKVSFFSEACGKGQERMID